jgi:hypothetical protein
MAEHWAAGYDDVIRMLRHPGALQRPVAPAGAATFDIALNGRDQWA